MNGSPRARRGPRAAELRRLGVSLLAFLVVSSGAAEIAAQPDARGLSVQPRRGDARVRLNLDDVELPELVDTISRITGRRFVSGAEPRPIRATIQSPDKVTPQEAYAAFRAVLADHGMTVRARGRYLEIAESQGVVVEVSPRYGPITAGPDDHHVTRLVHLSHLKANEAATILEKFATRDGDATAYAPSNLLIVTEAASNLERLVRIATAIDIARAGEGVYVEPMNYVSAKEFAAKLPMLVGSGSSARVVVDNLTNVLLIVATDVEYRRLLDLINREDVEEPREAEDSAAQRAVREREARQELIDRGFLFRDRTPWSPPADFSKKRGLVDEIRHAILAAEDEWRR